MQRREMVLGALGGVAGMAAGKPAQAQTAKALPVPPSGSIGFKVFRNGEAVGEHHLNFTQNGDQLQVSLNAELVVRVAGIAVFRYSCTAAEHWQGSQFCGVDSKVNQNGTPLEVHASPIPGGFAVTSTKAGNYNYTGQPAMLPLTYWNKAMLDAMILNVDTGRHYPAIVNSPGWNYLTSVEGRKLLARRFDVTGKLHMSVWYDQYGQWDGLEFNYMGAMTYQKYAA